MYIGDVTNTDFKIEPNPNVLDKTNQIEPNIQYLWSNQNRNMKNSHMTCDKKFVRYAIRIL